LRRPKRLLIHQDQPYVKEMEGVFGSLAAGIVEKSFTGEILKGKSPHDCTAARSTNGKK